jgi:TolB-like protein/Tfp pilus assembly protein PilF
MPDSNSKIGQFWQELKRRKVLKVLIMYAGAAIVLIGLASDIAGPLNLPDWAPRLIIILVIIGFPITMVLSWIFDITPEGVNLTTALEHSNMNEAHLSKHNSNFKGSIAVLPFQDMSPQKDQEYFCEGISEEIINALTRIERLKVIARTSAFAFKGNSMDIREIGKILNVEHVLEGSIRKDGNQLRITAQLIKVEDGFHLWSEAYTRELKDIFTIQEEISLSIVKNLNFKLIGEEKGRLLKRPTEDTEAFQYYLKGLYCWQQMTPEGNQLAQEYYTKAFTKDPKFALAYAILGSNYLFGGSIGLLPPLLVWQKSKELTHKALEIDNTIPVAHSSLAIIKMLYNWDWEGTEREFKIALEISPNSGWDHFFYSFYLRLTNRLDEAIAESISALDYDPYNILISTQVGVTYLMAGLVDQAIEKQEWTIGIYPNSFLAHMHLGDALLAKSQPGEAIQSYEKAVQLSGGNPMAIAGLACAYHVVGKVEEAKRSIQDLAQRMEKEYVPASVFIPYYLIMNDLDRAYQWMERACHEKEFILPIYIVSLLIQDRIPEEPRFRALVEQTGLDKYWKYP